MSLLFWRPVRGCNSNITEFYCTQFVYKFISLRGNVNLSPQIFVKLYTHRLRWTLWRTFNTLPLSVLDC